MAFEDHRAGPTLDWLVLHHVMDWKQGFVALGQAPYLGPAMDGRPGESSLWPVSTDEKAARQVVDSLERRGFKIEWQPRDGGCEVTIRRSPDEALDARAGTMPLAFCRAAMLAVEAGWILKPWPQGRGGYSAR